MKAIIKFIKIMNKYKVETNLKIQTNVSAFTLFLLNKLLSKVPKSPSKIL